MAAFYIRLLKLFNSKLKHVYTAHNVFKDKLPLYRFALKNAKSVAVGEAVNKNLKEDVGITDSSVIYNGVIFKETDNKVDEIVNSDGIKLGCIARLSEQKGLIYLIEAMSLLTVKDIRLFIVGDGELKNELENKYDLLIICNPNNPTGKFLKLAQTEEILKECNKYDTKLFIDEAFIEFLADGMKESIINTEENKKNLFVTRAFTKFFAIPGLRLGYGMYFDKELEKKISEKKEPWSVNNFAEMAGLTVLDDAEYIEKTLKWIAEEKIYMYEKLNKISGMKVYETEVNFITGKIDEKLFSEGLNVKILREKMLEQGILIRDASNFKFLDERFFRLAIKDRASNERVIEAMKEIFRKKGVKSFNE